MERIVDIIAVRSVLTLSTAWVVMMATALAFDGEMLGLLKAPYLIFVTGAFVSLMLSCLRERRPAAAFSHLADSAALLVGAGLIESVRISLALL